MMAPWLAAMAALGYGSDFGFGRTRRPSVARACISVARDRRPSNKLARQKHCRATNKSGGSHRHR